MTACCVLDAAAVIAWLRREPGAETVRQLLEEAAALSRRVLVSVMNLGEVYYVLWRRHGERLADERKAQLELLPWGIVSVDDELVWQAAKLKARYPLSYADAFAVATAIRHDAEIVTCDREILALPPDVARVHPLQ